MVNSTTQQLEVFEVALNGNIVESYLMDPYEINQAIDEGRHIIMHGWSQRIFKPKWDFAISDWVEGLPNEDVTNKLSQIEEQKNKPSDEEMNAIAIMELTQMLLGGE